MDKGLNTGDPGTMCSANTQPALRVPGGSSSGRESGGMAARTALPASKGTCASMDGTFGGGAVTNPHRYRGAYVQ